jgi:hypothetical protein
LERYFAYLWILAIDDGEKQKSRNNQNGRCFVDSLHNTSQASYCTVAEVTHLGGQNFVYRMSQAMLLRVTVFKYTYVATDSEILVIYKLDNSVRKLQRYKSHTDPLLALSPLMQGIYKMAVRVNCIASSFCAKHTVTNGTLLINQQKKVTCNCFFFVCSSKDKYREIDICRSEL